MTTNAKGMKPSDITNEIVMEIKYALYELSHVQHGERCFTPRKWAQIEAVLWWKLCLRHRWNNGRQGE